MFLKAQVQRIYGFHHVQSKIRSKDSEVQGQGKNVTVNDHTFDFSQHCNKNRRDV